MLKLIVECDECGLTSDSLKDEYGAPIQACSPKPYAHIIRHELRKHGWYNYASEDLCPECAKKRGHLKHKKLCPHCGRRIDLEPTSNEKDTL